VKTADLTGLAGPLVRRGFGDELSAVSDCTLFPLSLSLSLCLSFPLSKIDIHLANVVLGDLEKKPRRSDDDRVT